MKKIIECVPNFSEGSNQQTVNEIAASVKGISGVVLLDVDSDKDYNRSVLTFAGSPKKVFKAAFSSIKTASELIDMRFHEGVHPCIGAIDVVPFVPVKNVTMKECVFLAKELGKKVAEELEIPVFLYGEAAASIKRKNLAEIRRGGYSALEEKLKKKEWKPDFGRAKFNSKSGACIIGARDFLIAFNIDLNSGNAKKAKIIASKIRESSGGLKAIKAIGVFLKSKGIAQVSINVENFNVTGLHCVFSEVLRLAKELECRATASEIIGLVPKKALLEAGRFYAPKAVDENSLIAAAINGLNLRDFDVKKKVLDYRLGF